MRLRPILVAATVIAVGVLSVPVLRRWMASDEARIRWRIDDALADFNDGRVRAADALAPTFTDETSGLGREDVRGAIAFVVLRRPGPGGRFGYRLEPAAEPELQVGEGTATVTLRLRLHDVRTDPPRLLWELEIEGELRRDDGDWQFTRSRHVTLAGDRPR
jgi:hypothetical protein